MFTDMLADQNYKFTSKERDYESASQFDYFVARHYAWRLGRFLQPDEFAGGPVDAFSSNDPLPPGPLPYADITNPQSLNKYAYTYNNPLRYTDPSGHCPECIHRIDQAMRRVFVLQGGQSKGLEIKGRIGQIRARGGVSVGYTANATEGTLEMSASAGATLRKGAVIVGPGASVGVKTDQSGQTTLERDFGFMPRLITSKTTQTETSVGGEVGTGDTLLTGGAVIGNVDLEAGINLTAVGDAVSATTDLARATITSMKAQLQSLVRLVTPETTERQQQENMERRPH